MDNNSPKPDEEMLIAGRGALGLLKSLARQFPGTFKIILPLDPDEEALILACRARGNGTTRRLLGCVEKASN